MSFLSILIMPMKSSMIYISDCICSQKYIFFHFFHKTAVFLCKYFDIYLVYNVPINSIILE